jgi:hypothetical protein
MRQARDCKGSGGYRAIGLSYKPSPDRQPG